MEDKLLKGGEFLIKDVNPSSVFTPEDMTEEQLMVFNTVHDFIDNEVFPLSEKIEKQQDNVVPTLLVKAAELGLLGAHIPENYGGMGMDGNTITAISEAMGKGGSFTVAFAAHTGIGMLPIYYYGTEAQKQKYLPRLCNGELKASYCLTEPGSGSDALAAKTKATPQGDNYIINGQKMWITNAGFADIFIVFAQVEASDANSPSGFTGFIIEKGTQGLTVGAEEAKLGIKGSSTRQVFFENVVIPKENVLGEIGKGHLIAFNVLNIGRFKLAVSVLGGAKESFQDGINYAKERIQFKVPIAEFGAIQHKIAQQSIKIFALESAIYRLSELLEATTLQLVTAGMSPAEAKLKAAEDYAVECAILKVFGSEVLDYVVDESLQIHGGNGFSEEYKCSRNYRDSRINRIFEGTNEINRLLSVSMLIKKGMKGEIDIVSPAWAVQKELASMPSFEKPEGPFADQQVAVKNLKKLVLMTAGAAVKYQMDGKLDLKIEQEIVMNIADIMIELYAAESMLLRVMKNTANGKASDTHEKILTAYIYDATFSCAKHAADAINSFASGDELRILNIGIKRFTKYESINIKSIKRDIATHAIKGETALV